MSPALDRANKEKQHKPFRWPVVVFLAAGQFSLGNSQRESQEKWLSTDSGQPHHIRKNNGRHWNRASAKFFNHLISML